MYIWWKIKRVKCKNSLTNAKVFYFVKKISEIRSNRTYVKHILGHKCFSKRVSKGRMLIMMVDDIKSKTMLKVNRRGKEQEDWLNGVAQ